MSTNNVLNTLICTLVKKLVNKHRYHFFFCSDKKQQKFNSENKLVEIPIMVHLQN